MQTKQYDKRYWFLYLVIINLSGSYLCMKQNIFATADILSNTVNLHTGHPWNSYELLEQGPKSVHNGINVQLFGQNQVHWIILPQNSLLAHCRNYCKENWYFPKWVEWYDMIYFLFCPLILWWPRAQGVMDPKVTLEFIIWTLIAEPLACLAFHYLPPSLDKAGNSYREITFSLTNRRKIK